MRLRTILVAAMLVLAGCSGFGGSTDGTATDDATVTDGTGPMEGNGTAADGSTGEASNGSSTETTTESDDVPATSGAYPDGVSANGVENLSALLADQRAALNGTAHVTEYWLNASLEGESQNMEQTTHTLERVDGDGTVSYIGNRTGSTGTRAVSIYGNDSVGFAQQVTNSAYQNETTYTRAISASHLQSRLGGNFFTIYVALGNYTTVETAGSGESARITLEATEQNETFTEQLGGTNVTSYAGTLVVDGDGVIRSADITMSANTSQGPASYVIDFDQESIGGDVTVSQPSWYATALEETTDVGMETSVVDGTTIELTNTGSDPIASGRAISLVREQSATGGYVQIQESIAPGETVYVYKTDANGRFQLSSSTPNDAVSLSGTYRLELSGNLGMVSATSTVTFD